MPPQKQREGQGRRVRETVKERAARAKQARLERMAQDVQEGTLVIRQMTAEEREQFPPREPVKQTSKRRSRYQA